MNSLYLIAGLVAIAALSIWLYGKSKQAEGETAAKEAASEAARKVETDMATEMNKDISDADLMKRYEDRSKS
jgi:hypothetical protein